MKRIFAFLLVLCMTAAALTGCGDTKKLLGTWQAQLDLTDAMQQALQLEGFSQDYQVESFQVTATLTFLEDHTYTLALDEASVEAASDALLKKLPVEQPPRLLLHACCAPCSSYVLSYLAEYFSITIFFFAL